MGAGRDARDVEEVDTVSDQDGRRSVRVTLPAHLRTLAGVAGEVTVELDEPVTARRVVDVLEQRHPPLRGTIRDRATSQRRAFVRFYADGEDLSHADVDAPLPDAVVSGRAPFQVVGAMAGG